MTKIESLRHRRATAIKAITDLREAMEEIQRAAPQIFPRTGPYNSRGGSSAVGTFPLPVIPTRKETY